MSVSGDTAAVGAYGDDDKGRSSGSVYVFGRSAGSWSQQAKLLASDGKDIDELGVSVALLGDTLVAGAVLGDAAYIYVRDAGGGWSQQAKLTAVDGRGLPPGGSAAEGRRGSIDGALGDNFGNSVALLGDTAVIGAPFNSALGAESGAAYVFSRSGTAWTQQATLRASDGESADLFGTAVAVSGDTILSGSLGDDDRGTSAGAVYVFAPPVIGRNLGVGCSLDAECASGACVDGVCCDSTCGGGDPGDCQACSVAAGGAADGTCGPVAANTVCRPAAGACDVAERCTGASPACPSDKLVAANTICRGAAGACDVAERCSGSSAACPTDQLAPADTACRPANGSCDVRETCTGGSSLCPPDQLRPNLSICRSPIGLPGLCLDGICLL